MAGKIPQNGAYTRTESFAREDDHSFARFYRDTILDEGASREAGREIWVDVEMVEIILPGNQWTRPVLRVTDEHRQRWPKLYEKFQREEEQRPDGKPLEEWPEVSRAMVKELKHLDFFTVEQVAEMSEIAISRIGMGARVLKEKAQAYVQEAAKMAPINKLVAENDKLKAMCDTQAGQIKDLGHMLEQLQSQMSDFRNAQHPLATVVPGMLDPAQAQGYGPGGGAAPVAARPVSALDKLAAKPRRVAAAAPQEVAEAPRPRSKKATAAGGTR